MKRLVIGVFLFLIVLIGFLGYFTYTQITVMNRPWGQSPEDDFIITIEEGKSAKDIANQLVEEGVVDNPNMFVVMADLRGFADKLKAGEYMIRGASTPAEIMDLFAIGWNYRHSIVIPEGWTQGQIAARYDTTGICSKEDFFAECHTRSDVFPFVIVQAPDGGNAALEGVLFPDTYKFIKNTPAERIVNRMVSRFNTVWEEIMTVALENPDEDYWWRPGEQATKKNMHDVVVLASIIEREVAKEEDRPKVASVFVNRLQKNMPLQTDASLYYYTGKSSQELTKEDLQEDHPYNTYVNTGLPPSAIGNPGRSALRAAMFPADTDYLYFLSLPDGTTLFANTHDEHVKNKQEMKRQRALGE